MALTATRVRCLVRTSKTRRILEAHARLTALDHSMSPTHQVDKNANLAA